MKYATEIAVLTWDVPGYTARGEGSNMTQPQIDPIAHAWRQCNPHTPLPSALALRLAPSGLALSLYSTRSPLVAEPSRNSQDIQHSLLIVATLPLVSLPSE